MLTNLHGYKARYYVVGCAKIKMALYGRRIRTDQFTAPLMFIFHKKNVNPKTIAPIKVISHQLTKITLCLRKDIISVKRGDT